jgi:hypothetical protein
MTARVSIYYTHLLIPVSRRFKPSSTQVSRFLDAVLREGFVPASSELFAPRLAALEGEQSFDVGVGGVGIPLNTPLAIGHYGDDEEWRPFEEPYDLKIGCSLRPSPVWTSDDQEHFNTNPGSPFFDDPCSDKDRTGCFTHPNTLEIIEVPHGGCACFWISIEFGKFLFPDIEDSLDLAAPELVALAQKTFGIEFVQGCRWG